jgi:hypothetical protein
MIVSGEFDNVSAIVVTCCNCQLMFLLESTYALCVTTIIAQIIGLFCQSALGLRLEISPFLATWQDRHVQVWSVKR